MVLKANTGQELDVLEQEAVALSLATFKVTPAWPLSLDSLTAHAWRVICRAACNCAPESVQFCRLQMQAGQKLLQGQKLSLQ